MGAEIVEVDIRRSKDGEFVVMHDSWLDRTTTCKGEVVKHTLAELKTCRLVIEGTRAVTDERVSTLREMLMATRDRILINLDNKLDVGDLPGMIAVARDLGMADQVIVKENLWNQSRIATVKAAMAAIGGGVQFMPIIADDAVHDAGFAETVDHAFSPRAIELINWRAGAETLTETGGPLFSTRMRAAAVRGNWHIWADTYAIVNKPGGFLPAAVATNWRCRPACRARPGVSGPTAAPPSSRPTSRRRQSTGWRRTAIACLMPGPANASSPPRPPASIDLPVIGIPAWLSQAGLS